MQLVFPTAGRAEILGRPLGDLAMKRRIGYLPENPYFYDYLTAEELLTYFASLFGYRGQERRTRAARLLDEVGIGAERRLQLRKFSKGMSAARRHRAGSHQRSGSRDLRRAHVGARSLGRRDVRALILRLRDRGCTVFFSSHVLSDAEALCSRVAILAKGRLVASGRLSDMLAFQARGWELVVADLSESVVSALGSECQPCGPDWRRSILLGAAARSAASTPRHSTHGGRGRLMSINRCGRRWRTSSSSR